MYAAGLEVKYINSFVIFFRKISSTNTSMSSRQTISETLILGSSFQRYGISFLYPDSERFDICARASREATKWVPVAVRMFDATSDSKPRSGSGFGSDSGFGKGGSDDEGATPSFGLLVLSRSFGRRHGAPVIGCLDTPKGMRK